MSEEQQQAVVEQPDEQAAPVSEEPNAQDDDLDQLLEQFDRDTTQTPEQQNTQETGSDFKALSEMQKRIQAMESERAVERDNRDFESLVDVLAKDSQFPRAMVAGTVRQLAIDDPKIAEAFEKRFANPKAWDAAQRRLTTRYSELQKTLPDKNLSEDREAVSHAVRGAAKKAPEEPDVNEDEVRQMNDAQFESWIRSQAKKSA